jgi:hypothetical protein
MLKIFCLTLTISVFLPALSASQWFDQQSVDATVLLDKIDSGQLVPHGTGFVLYNYQHPEFPIVVTCAHLLKNADIVVTVNADSSLVANFSKHDIDTLVFLKRIWVLENGILRCRVRLTSKPIQTFLVDPKLDVGIFLIDLPSSITIDSTHVSQRVSCLKCLPRSMIFHKSEILTGDDTYFIGFPFGLGTEKRINPVIRSASVAWQDDGTPEFLLDALSFGGNSGSPIFTKATINRRIGVIETEGPKLVGMVLGHLGDSLQGVLTQPNTNLQLVQRQDVEIQNWGLARCLWFDEIQPLVNAANTLSVAQ